MILAVMSWGFLFLATVVRSAVSSAQTCVYLSSGATCTGAVYGDCTDLCAFDEDCSTLTCNSFAIGMIQAGTGMTNWDECYLLDGDGYDVISTCEDDGEAACGDDIEMCATACVTSTNGQCSGICYDTPVDLSAYQDYNLDCNGYAAYLPVSYPDFTAYCECFTVDNGIQTYDMMLNCGSGSCISESASEDESTSEPTSEPTSDDNSESSGSGSSGDNSLIIGIAVGAAVLVVAIIIAIICIKSRRKL